MHFVQVGNSSNPNGGYLTMMQDLAPQNETDQGAFGAALPTEMYPADDYVMEYDGWADWPNLVDTGHPADLAAWGSWTHHLLYTAYPREREDYLRYVEGNVTYVLIPNAAGNDAAAELGYDRVEGAPGGSL